MTIYYNASNPASGVSGLQGLDNASADAIKKRGMLVVISQSKDADDALASTATVEHALFRGVSPMLITKCSYIPDDTLDAHDTNYATLTVYIRTQGDVGQVQEVLSRKTTKITGGSGNWLSFEAVDLGSPALPNISDGQYLSLEITKSGSGVIVPSGIWQVEGYLA